MTISYKYKFHNIYQILLICIVLIIYYSISFPGIINWEGLRSIEDGAGFFNDYTQIDNNMHSVFLKYLWGGFHYILQHVSLVWCLNIFFYVIVCFYISQSFKYISSICFLLLTLWPPIFLCMENFKAETTGIIFILLSYKLLYQYINCKEQVISFLVPLFCIIFLACRFDDILAAIPLIILFFSKFKNKNKNIINSKKYFNYICQSGIIIILCIVFIYIPNKTTRYISHRETSFMTWDLIGIHLNADIQSFMIGDIKINMDEKKKYYNTYNGDAYWWGDNISSITPGLSITYWDKSLVDSTRNKWFESIIQYPFAYLKHRLKIAYLFFFDRSWYLEDENTHHNGKFVTRIVDQVQLKIPYSERRYDYKKLYWKFRFDNLWIHGIYIISSIIFTLFLYIFYKYATHTIYKFQFALFLLLSLLCTSLKVIFIPAVHFRYGLWMPIASILIFSILLDNLLYYSTKKFIKRIDIINHR